MLSLFSTLGGLLISGLPKLLDFFQNKDDQKHELALAKVQVELQLQMMAQGFKAQERMEEIRTDQIAMQTDAQMTEAALKHDEKIMEKALLGFCWLNLAALTSKSKLSLISLLSTAVSNVRKNFLSFKFFSNANKELMAVSPPSAPINPEMYPLCKLLFTEETSRFGLIVFALSNDL